MNIERYIKGLLTFTSQTSQTTEDGWLMFDLVEPLCIETRIWHWSQIHTLYLGQIIFCQTQDLWIREWNPDICLTTCSPRWKGWLPTSELGKEKNQPHAAICECSDVFSQGPTDMDLTDLVKQTINTGDQRPVRLSLRALSIVK